MSFLKSLFRNRRAQREALQRYVDMEFHADDREAELNRLIREAGL